MRVLFLTVISDGTGRVAVRDPPDLGRHRRREQRDLLVLRRGLEDRLDVLGEAHVQHLVGLVEHDVLHVREVERAPLQVVHDAARRTDDDVHTAPQRGELDAVALPP